jgi:hypothetical protein
MLILYGIFGIITVVFLGIVITGAIYAHRHPERFWSQKTAGRLHQSRAKGIARATLETLPIFKFCDQEDKRQQAARSNIETAGDKYGSENGTRNKHPERSKNPNGTGGCNSVESFIQSASTRG